MVPNRTLGRLLVFVFLASAAFAQTSVDRIVVLKRKHRMLLMYGDKVVRSYAIALGRGGLAPKRRQGDGRTPEGIYRIDYRNPASKFHLALHISYPELGDRKRARGLGVNPGGDIMIHGLPPGYSWVGDNHRIADWTDGCIAVTDPQIEEIWKMVANGTPVEIRP